MTRDTPPEERGRRAAATAIGQVFVLLGASLIAVVVTTRLSPGPRLDAYFTASQLAVTALYLGQGLRTAVPGLAVSGLASPQVLARATGALIVGVGVLLLIAAVLVPALLPDAGRADMRRDLLVLLPGALLQVGTGYAAGRLALRGEFGRVALAYAAGTLVNGALLAVWLSDGGTSLLAPAALAGWTLSGTLIFGSLSRLRRPDRKLEPSNPVGLTARGALGRIVLSVAPVLAAQMIVFVSVTGAAHLQSGGATLLSLAVLAVNAVATVAVSPIPVVLAADYGATWDRSAASLFPTILAVVRLSVAVCAPLVLLLILVGEPVAQSVLQGLSTDDVHQLFDMILMQLPTLPFTAAGLVGLVAVVSLDRLGRTAALVAGVTVLHVSVVLVAVVLELDLGSLALLFAGATLLLGIAGLAVPLGDQTLPTLLRIARASVGVAAPSAAVLVGARLLDRPSLGIGVLLAAVALVVQAAWLRWRSPDEFALLTRVISRRNTTTSP